VGQAKCAGREPFPELPQVLSWSHKREYSLIIGLLHAFSITKLLMSHH